MAPLSFDQAPPITVPFRFFLVAPLFAMVAALWIAVDAPSVVASRWASSTLVVTHLMTLGFITQVMLGALLQFMPVAAGANVAWPRLTAAIVQTGLCGGLGALLSGFLGGGTVAFVAAAFMFAGGLGWFVAIMAAGLWRSPAIGPTLRALRFAVVGLALAAALGITLALGLAGVVSVPLLELTHVHAAWALFGWGLTLLAAVAWLVVPMFQITPPYSLQFCWLFPGVLYVGLTLWSATTRVADGLLHWLSAALVSVAVIAFSALTLRLQRRRKRRQIDTTVRYWALAMLLLIATVPLFAAHAIITPSLVSAKLEWIIGVVVIAGAFPAVISGMLTKIVPFLVWLHLKNVMFAPPTMQKYLSERALRRQFWLFTSALVLLIGGAWWLPLARIGALVYAAAIGWLWWQLGGAVRAYRTLSPSVPAA